MSLKNLHKNYSKLLSAFKSAGVTLNESQKADMDAFIIALEGTINESKNAIVKATEKVVTKKLEKEYKDLFESILKHQSDLNIIAGKVQSKIAVIKESKNIENCLDIYLTEAVEKALPVERVIDIKRMQKLESLQESLRDLLVINDDRIDAKKAELEAKYINENKELQKKFDDLQKQLTESADKIEDMTKKLAKSEAKELLESKIKDLPIAEANKMKRRFAGASKLIIESKFDTVLKKVQEETEEEIQDEETSLEEEIANIINSDDSNESEKNSDETDSVADDDTADESESDDTDDSSTNNDEVSEDEDDDDEYVTDDSDETDEDTEEIKIDEDDDDEELPPEDRIDESYMTAWIKRAGYITPLR